MLETLHVENIAVIDSAEIQFGPGLNILSGETGAGKSIVISSISLLLGGRASTDLIRKGCEEASIDGLFNISEMPWIQPRLADAGIPIDSSDPGTLLIRRTVHRSGKSRIHINGRLATLAILQTVTEGLVDLCGQHEHQSLVKPAIQMDLVDRFGGIQKKFDQWLQRFLTYKTLKKEFEEILRSEEIRIKKTDFLKFQIEEIQKANLSPNEDEQLQDEKKKLQTSQTRIQLCGQALALLDVDDSGIISMLRSALAQTRSLAELDPQTESLHESIQKTILLAEESSVIGNRILNQIESNPHRLEEVQQRLSDIVKLRKKYGSTVDAILSHLQLLQTELQQLQTQDERSQILLGELNELQKELSQSALKIHQSRQSIAKNLSESVTAEIRELRMGNAELSIELEYLDSIDDWSTSLGPSQIQILVRTNAGDSAHPIGKIASGGELSRILLGVRRVIADRGKIGVYLFDEIDAGIGGQTAFQVGRKLKSVSRHNQVICITHLPQVASFADRHLCVQKRTASGKTKTQIINLTPDEKSQEIARMLGGDAVSPASLKNAVDLMKQARIAV